MIRKNPVRVKLVKTPKFKKTSKVVIELSPEHARALKHLSYYNVTVPNAIRQLIGRGSHVDEMKEVMTQLSYKFTGIYP